MHAYDHLVPQVHGEMALPDTLRARRMLQERFLIHERLVPLLSRVDFLMRRPARSRAAATQLPEEHVGLRPDMASEVQSSRRG